MSETTIDQIGDAFESWAETNLDNFDQMDYDLTFDQVTWFVTVFGGAKDLYYTVIKKNEKFCFEDLS